MSTPVVRRVHGFRVPARRQAHRDGASSRVESSRKQRDVYARHCDHQIGALSLVVFQAVQQLAQAKRHALGVSVSVGVAAAVAFAFYFPAYGPVLTQPTCRVSSTDVAHPEMKQLADPHR